MNRSIARKIKKTSHINLATENMQRRGLRRLDVYYRDINKHWNTAHGCKGGKLMALYYVLMLLFKRDFFVRVEQCFR